MMRTLNMRNNKLKFCKGTTSDATPKALPKLAIKWLVDDDEKLYPESIFSVSHLPTQHSNEQSHTHFFKKAIEIKGTGFSAYQFIRIGNEVEANIPKYRRYSHANANLFRLVSFRMKMILWTFCILKPCNSLLFPCKILVTSRKNNKKSLEYKIFQINLMHASYHFFTIFFLSGFSFTNIHTSQESGLQRKGEGIYLTPLYHFQPLQRHLNISRAITAESSPLHIGISRTQTGNLWFASYHLSFISSFSICMTGPLIYSNLKLIEF